MYPKNANIVHSEIERLLKEKAGPDTPGMICGIIYNGSIVYISGIGLADPERKIPVNTFTNFRIASVSKQFTATGIMILKERGMLDYEDTLGDIFPDFPGDGKKITVRHLLTHTSGIIDYEDFDEEPGKDFLTDKDVLEIVENHPELQFEPGSRHKYSNTGYALLALIIENISGLTFPAFMEQNIFVPLGMKNSLVHIEDETQIPNRAFGYVKDEHGFTRRDQGRTTTVLGDGGVYTSITDFAKWDNALYEGKPATLKTLEEAWTPMRLNDGTITDYGFGWRIKTLRDRKILWHDGLTCGFNSGVRRVPEEHLTLMAFSNFRGKEARRTADEILELMLK